MGWNEGYSIYEKIIVSTYDAGVLTKKLLNNLLEPFQNTDMDHGGEAGIKTKDGLSADEVVVKIGNPEYWEKFTIASQKLFKECRVNDSWELQDKFDWKSEPCKQWDDLYDEFYNKWQEITKTF